MDDESVKKSRKPDKRSREKQSFGGFTQEDVNKYFCMPNMAMDIIAEIDSLAELKVVLYIMRHTWGFHEYEGEKRITVDEFMHGRKSKGERIDAGTNLSEMSVRNGLDLAIEHGFILCHVDDKDRAKVKKSYSLHIKSGVKILDPTRKNGVKTLEVGVQKLYPASTDKGKVFRPGSEKDKEETHQEKDTAPSSSFDNEQTGTRREKLPKLIQSRLDRIFKDDGYSESEREHVNKEVWHLYQQFPLEVAAFRNKIDSARGLTQANHTRFVANLKAALKRE